MHYATHWDCSGSCFLLLVCLFFSVQSKSKVSESIFLITLRMETCRTSEVKIKVLTVALREWLHEVASSFIKLHLPLILAGGTSHVAPSTDGCSRMRCVISLLASSQHGRKPLVLFIYLSRAQTAIFVWRAEFIFLFSLFLSLLIFVQRLSCSSQSGHILPDLKILIHKKEPVMTQKSVE